MKVLIIGAASTNGLRSLGIGTKISGGGWVENLIDSLAVYPELSIFSAFYTSSIRRVAYSQLDGVNYIALPARDRRLYTCTPKMVDDLKEMLSRVQPDIVHIIGTEREHDLRLFELAGADRTVVSITGMVSICAKHYYGGVDRKEFCWVSIGDIIRRGGPLKEKARFEQWGVYERELLRKAKYVMGRTTWDYACVKQINPQIEYTYCSEILNPIYSANKWDIRNIVRHRIFVSQATYPLKGFHVLLEAFPQILERYPDTEIYVAGANILSSDTLMDRIKRTTYAEYLLRRIDEMDIPREKIHYVGALDAQGMLEQYLKCNVFVLPSIIENSSNSLGEAMCLGVPCIASFVGGVQDTIRNRIDGLFYPFDEPYMLSFFVCKVFEDDSLALELGRNAIPIARERFNPSKVKDATITLYQHIYEEVNGKEQIPES